MFDSVARIIARDFPLGAFKCVQPLLNGAVANAVNRHLQSV